MMYSDAVKFKKENTNLIGTITEKGMRIGKLIIVPADEGNRKAFLSSYVLFGDEEKAILPYVNFSVEVWAIDYEFSQKRFLSYKRLA